jgi:hypothetical protein
MVTTTRAQKDETKPLTTTNAPQASTAPVANPVSSFVKQQLTRFNKNMVAAAEAMPAEKYNFKPTPEMNTFGHLTIHIAEGNNALCSQISGTPAPTSEKLAGSGTQSFVRFLRHRARQCRRFQTQ